MQVASNILMVCPANFQYNVETAESNDYQNDLKTLSKEEINQMARREHQRMVEQLREVEIEVMVIEDTVSPIKPDAIFPNNWIMMHQTGQIILFPMKNYNRQLEKRKDIVEQIQKEFNVSEIIDLGYFESENMALEGTGSIVFDHLLRKAYACISPRTDRSILDVLCKKIGYEAVVFHAVDQNNHLIYHTNVVMCIGEGFVVISMNAVKDEDEKKMLLDQFKSDNLEVIDIDSIQLNQHFAGNMLQVMNNTGEKYLVMSQRAFSSLSEDQKSTLKRFTHILPVDIDIIETVGGGSARCMMAEIFLTKK